VDEDRLLAMSAFEAAFLIRSFRAKNPQLTTDELVATARAVRADFSSHDYVAGAFLEERVSPQLTTSAEMFFVAAAEVIIASDLGVWPRLAPAGRSHVLKAIGVNGAQCLRAAGLLDNSPRAVEWWDGLATRSRGGRDARLLAQGRKGELLSLAHEARRLREEGFGREPVWVALEDNTVGYDILSYSRQSGREVNRLIEVKTTEAAPPRMFLSRNEWAVAEQFGSTFEFHLWELPLEKLRIFTVDEIRLHIPSNHGQGRWQSTDICFYDAP
jgi:hypothetical protein